MAEYIEREAAVKAFNNFDAGRADSPPFTLLTPEEFAEYLYELPAADVAPVVHAQWIEDGSGIIICPECKRGYNLIAKYTHYCPNCGAIMDGNANG